MNMEKKVCGNCLYHAAWDYPRTVFCERRFLDNGGEVIRETVDSCEEWMPTDACNCVRDYAKTQELT